MNFGYFGVFWRIISGILVYHYPPPPPADPDNSPTGDLQPPPSRHFPRGGNLMEVQPTNKPGVRGGGGELPYKSDSDARQKIEIKPLRETNVGAF